MSIHGPRKEKSRTFYDSLTAEQIEHWKKLLILFGVHPHLLPEGILRNCINTVESNIRKGIDDA